MQECTAIAKALSDENRVRALMFLGEGGLCVCQIIEMLGLAPSTVSRHMTVLEHAGLVTSRKEGRWVYYDLPGAQADPVVRGALRWVRRALGADPVVRKDLRRLRNVLRTDREELCERYRRR